MSDIEKLKRKRGSIKAKVTIFSKFLDNLELQFPDKKINDYICLHELEERFERFRTVLDEFEEVQTEIDQICTEENIAGQVSERESFDKDYYLVSGRAKALCNANSSVPPSAPSHVNSGSSVHSANSGRSGAGNESNIKLPIIQLPKFDGTFNNWLEFRDSFDSLINKNDHISEIQKFHYLRASLSHGALEIIASLEFTSSNYNIAWDLLCKRYNNTRILVQNHVKALFSLDNITGESSQSLRKLTDTVTKHLRALSILNEPTENWDTLIIHIVSQKLDSLTLREWEQKKALLQRPTLENLKEFIRDRADLLESLENNKTKTSIKHKFENKTKSFVSSNQLNCPFCKQSHFAQDCSEFQKLSINSRLTEVKNKKLCINCLRAGHLIKQCRSGSCRLCKGRHHTLLHFETDKEKTDTQKSENSDSNAKGIVCSTGNVHSSNSQVLLSTVLIRAVDKHNKTRVARALLDAGSQSSFITSRLAQALDLDFSDIDLKICGLNRTESNVKHRTSLHIQSRCNNFTREISCLVVPEITGALPNFPIDKNSLDIPAHIILADPDFNIPGTIDVLLGADHFWHVLCVGQIKLSNTPGVILQKSRFGWIISGELLSNQSPTVLCNLSTHFDIDKQLTRFWEIEEVEVSKPLSREEKDCEAHFLNTLERSETGNFVVSIPLKESPDILGDSYENAKRRLLSLERKFKGNPSFKLEYSNFIHEYIALGHMYKVPEHDNSKISYYLPHHGVVKESSLTTKLRVVFDASCATTSGHSFNSLQMIGPKIQPDLFNTLVRFRTYNYVICGDIEKMYRMCLVNPNQRSLQRILWRDNPENSIEWFELATVTYGTSSAAYLAVRCLYQVGLECQEESPIISNAIKNHFYVDDFLSGGKTISEVISLANNVSQTLKRYGFSLRKWISNSPEIIEGIESNDKINVLDFGTHEKTKTLGLLWSASSDSLTYSIGDCFGKRVTKRSILSESSQIFDPLGLLSPSTILAKILLQDLWSEKLSWDESLPNHLHTSWLRFRNELNCLNDLKIERQVVSTNFSSIDLHGFSDASTKAMGACIYLRCLDSEGNVKVSLVCAKSKVAPLKTQTVPRLELMGALLLVQLMKRVIHSLELKIDNTYFWCDSTVVLGWIRMSPSLLQPFVANRVARIQENSDFEHWSHVPTAYNPADHVSRGVMPRDLCSLDIYWNGPKWLSQDQSSWPQLVSLDVKLPDLRKIVHTITSTACTSFPFERYSDLVKLERIIAYCFRFKDNCLRKRRKEMLNHNRLSSQEIACASLRLAKLSQLDSFRDEINILFRNGQITKGPLAKLSPFLDDNNMIRVGGRLKESDFGFNKKHPILLSSKHTYTKLLFKKEHIRLLHAGPQQLLFSLREQYWPISARKLARKTVHQCIKCFKAKPRLVTPIMGNLPKSRLNPAPPFFTTGVDYAGPFQVKDRKGRGAKITKAYIALFICFVTRAIHLELVSDLTKDSFLATLRRFIARRGRPNQIYSDNGTNFLGAHSELNKLGNFLKAQASDLENDLGSVNISWTFIPAHSPHFGGLWEAGVKSTKHHLKRVAGNAALTFEQFSTLLTQIEGVLNSRPLSPLSSDPTDLSPLTPAHFLIGRPITAAADPDLTRLPTSRLDHFQQVQQIQQHFWSRWSVEYVSELQQRQKWSSSSTRQLQLNDLVLIKEDNQPPLKWCLGRIVALHPGADGVVRVATIKTSQGTIKRSFAKLCPLPIDSSV